MFSRHDAVGGGDDEPVGDQCAAAKEQPVQRYGRLPRVLADLRVRAADDSPVVAARRSTEAAAAVEPSRHHRVLLQQRRSPGRVTATAAAVSPPTVVRRGRPRSRVADGAPQSLAADRGGTGAPTPVPPCAGRVAVAAAGSGRRREVRRRRVVGREVVAVVVVRRMADGR